MQADTNWGVNLIRSSGGNLKITNSQFNDNFYSGLVAITNSGEIWAINNETLRNGGVGFILSSGGNLHYCSNYAALNLTGGASVTSRRTIYTYGNTYFYNGLWYGYPDYVASAANYISSDASCSAVVASSSSGEEIPADSNTQVVIVNTGEGDGIAEIKPGDSTVFKLFNQDRLVQLTALPSGSVPDGSSAVYTPLDANTLPGLLPEGTNLIPYGFNLSVTNPDGSPLKSLIGYMLIRFYLPEGFVLPAGIRLVIQHYDPATFSWTPMSTALGGGMAYTFASKPGTYVLTMVPIQ